jgi:hypothetical protein
MGFNVRSVLVVTLVALGLIGAAGCSRHGASSTHNTVQTGAVRPSASLPGGASPSSAALVYPDVPDVPGGTSSPLPFHEYRFTGGWRAADYDDRVLAAVQFRSTYPFDRVFLLEFATGRRVCALPGPVNSAAHYNINDVQVGGQWLAWVELSPGDDLTTSVEWKLYVAELNARTLHLGRPRLVDHDATKRTSRPMIAIAGGRLFWRVNGKRDPESPGLVYAARLGAKGPIVGRAIWATKGQLVAFGASADRICALERVSKAALPYRLLSARLDSPAKITSLDLDNRTDVAGYPAVSGGWSAWSLFADTEEALSGLLYLREPSGHMRFVASVNAIGPCFVGDRLFYSDNARVGATAVSRLCSVDLSTMKWSVVQQVEVVTASDLYTVMGPPTASHTLVTYRKPSDPMAMVVRVYQVR